MLRKPTLSIRFHLPKVKIVKKKRYDWALEVFCCDIKLD